MVSLDVNTSRVPKFALFEATFRLTRDFTNPYDTKSIDVYALVREPGGAQTRVDAFHAQDFRIARAVKDERLDPIGAPAWHVRFSPRKEGRHRVTLFCKTSEALVTGETIEFDCIGSDRPGFVRVAKNAQNFECDDGSPFFAIGLNTCWGKDTADYERWLLRMAENGINTGRLWIGPMFLFDPEPKDGLGKYDARAASRLDHVLELAERHNIRLMLCLESFNSLRIKPEYAEWQNNPYSAANGGPCTNPEDFFTNATARELFKRRLRYLVARWGYSPNVLAWEFWNEVDLVETYAPESIKTWHAEMADYINSIDPNKHLLTTSFSKPEGEAQIDALPQLSFVQTHSYSAKDLATEFSAYAAKQKTFARPHILGEFGLHWEGKGNTADPEGLHLRETIWSTALSGSAGCGMSWWWDSYIDPQNLWPVYRPLAAFTADIPWNRRVWQPLQSAISLNENAPGIPVDHFLKGIAPEWKAHASNTPQRIEVSAGGTMTGHETLAGILHGKGHHPELHNPATFVIDSPQPWRFNVVIKGVSGYGGANLEVRIDETTALKEDFRDTDPFKEDTIVTYNKTYSVEVPAGRHTVFAQNTGTDWVMCEYELRGAGASRLPPINIFGQQSRDIAFGWIQNTTASQLARSRALAPRSVDGATLKLAGLKDGAYALELWNTQTGSYETRNVRVKDCAIQQDLPPILSDLAFKLRRKKAMAYDDIQLLRPQSFPERLLEDVRDWCRGKWWHVRIPLLLYFAYVGVRQFGDTFYTSMFGGINLGIHEGGHLLFRSGGEFLHVAGGTILQLAAPLASMVMFFRQRDYFAIAICFGWLGTNFANIGVYMADAEKMVLPLVTVGDSPIVKHDWRTLFTKFGLLSHCEAIGGLTRGLAHLSMLLCVIVGVWLLWQMYRLPPKPRKPIKV